MDSMNLTSLPSDEHVKLTARAMAGILRDPTNADLGELADAWGMSTTKARRVFCDCAGISPKRFAQFVAAQTGLERLSLGDNALEASFEAGGSSAGFLHAVTCSAEALSPGEAASDGAGLTLLSGFFHTLLGLAFAARSDRGIIHLDLLDGEDEPGRCAARARLRSRFPKARISCDDSAFDDLRQALSPGRTPQRLHLLLSGTNFQIKTWQAALGIPSGATGTYGDLARAVQSPGASRAVGSAIGSNSIAMLIPCHRVLRVDGMVGDYKWSSWRKRAILALEAASRLSA